MRNRLWIMAGALALLAVAVTFYAIPAMAQSIRAALVKNIDEPGRNPYSATFTCTSPGFSACTAEASPVPAGMRLVVENVNAQIVVTPATTGVINVSLVTGDGQDKFLPVSFGVRIGSAQDRYWVNASVVQYVAAGATPGIYLHTFDANPSMTGTLTGYLVNLNN